MLVKRLLLVSFSCLLSMPLLAEEVSDAPTGNDDFDFYFQSFVENQLDDANPMVPLIADKLAEVFFNTTDEAEFRKRIQLLQESLKENPARLKRYAALDTRLKLQFKTRVDAAKKKRWIYTAVGAVVGAAVALPLGKLVGGKFTALGAKAMWIAIPIGALAGAGVGFLMGNLLAMPDYDYENGMIVGDIQRAHDEVAGLDLGRLLRDNE